MTRSINTPKQNVRSISKSAAEGGKIQAGTLAEDYDGVGKSVNVRLGRTTSGTVVRARISPYTIASFYPEGTAVSIKVDRGRAEVIAFGSVAQSSVFGVYEKTSASQSIGTGFSTPVQITFSLAQAIYDPYGMCDYTNNQIIVPFDGWYRLNTYTRWESADGARRHYVYVDGADRWLATTGSPDNGSGTMIAAVQGVAFSTLTQFTQDQTISLYVMQNSGAAINIVAAGLSIELVK